MRILGLDYETTGLNPSTDKVIEVGLVLWDTDSNTPLVTRNMLVRWPEVDSLPEEIVSLTGITQDLLNEFGHSPRTAAELTLEMVDKCDFIAAYNGKAFDQRFFNNWISPLFPQVRKKEWIDLQNDIPYPESIQTRKLIYLAAEHGFVNPFAHRAIFDVLTMFKVMSQYDISLVIARALIPTVYVQAVVGFNDKEKAKARGYRWAAKQKIWHRTMKQDEYEKERNAADFTVKLLEECPE